MKLLKKLVFSLILLLIACGAAVGGMAYWANMPLITSDAAPVPYSILPGSGLNASAAQIVAAGVPVQPLALEVLILATGNARRLKAGSYELKPGYSPLRLVLQLARGEFAQDALTVVEGWTFRQMRLAIASNPNLQHDTAGWSDDAIMKAIPAQADPEQAEGMFFPDTYLFARHSSDLAVYRQAYRLMQKRLDAAWAARSADLPYSTPYQALIMASIVEKETGHKDDRGLVAGVFMNRLKVNMPLQTDPTVIYGLGDQYSGKLHKSELRQDTPYNTYTRVGLPPTPIALPGIAALTAATRPTKTDAFYFVAKKDGSSIFSTNLNDHNDAVNTYQR